MHANGPAGRTAATSKKQAVEAITAISFNIFFELLSEAVCCCGCASTILITNNVAVVVVVVAVAVVVAVVVAVLATFNHCLGRRCF